MQIPQSRSLKAGARSSFYLQFPTVSPSDRSDTLSYSRVEVESYLPSGWNLEETKGSYDPKKACWRISVQDVSEFVSTLAVDQTAADKLGRIPALRAAIDRLVRRL